MIDHASQPVIQNTSSRLGFLRTPAATVTHETLQVMPDDHSELVPPLPIPNRTVKRLCADDSAATSVKVGYRQASYMQKPAQVILSGLFAFQRAENG